MKTTCQEELNEMNKTNTASTSIDELNEMNKTNAASTIILIFFGRAFLKEEGPLKHSQNHIL